MPRSALNPTPSAGDAQGARWKPVDAKLPIPEIVRGFQDYNSKERDYLDQDTDRLLRLPMKSDEGKAAVADVIVNRKRMGGWGDDIKDVVTVRGSLSPG